MAGSYPDVPAPRFAYDRGGVTIFVLNKAGDAIVSELSPADLSKLNDESVSEVEIGEAAMSTGLASAGWVCAVFDEPIDLKGFYAGGRSDTSWSAWSRLQSGPLQISADTVTGLDGMWTASPASPYTPKDDEVERDGSMRSMIAPLSHDGIVGLRFQIRVRSQYSSGPGPVAYLRSFHVYGDKSYPFGLAQLRLWHPTLDQPLTDGAWFDYGDVPRSSTAGRDRAFRVKNNSTTQTAGGVSLEVEVLTDATAPLPSQFTFEVAGGSGFSNPNADIGDLSPEEVSPLITLRRSTPVYADLGLWWPRLVASASTWT